MLTVLEFANVELLEMRFLDQRLDDALGLAYERLTQRSRKWLPFRSDPTNLRGLGLIDFWILARKPVEDAIESRKGFSLKVFVPLLRLFLPRFITVETVRLKLDQFSNPPVVYCQLPCEALDFSKPPNKHFVITLEIG